MKRLILVLACVALPFDASMAAGGAEAAPQGRAAIKLDIGTPPVVIVGHSMAQRSSRLVRFYESGAIGLGDDGLIHLRDDSKLSLVLRQIAEKLIDAENADRKNLIFAVADGNHRRDAQDEVRVLLVERWKSQFKSGWWLRDADNKWSRKP